MGITLKPNARIRECRPNDLAVVAADGMVNGFVGVLPVRMIYRGTPLRAALVSALMVDSPRLRVESVLAHDQIRSN